MNDEEKVSTPSDEGVQSELSVEAVSLEFGFAGRAAKAGV